MMFNHVMGRWRTSIYAKKKHKKTRDNDMEEEEEDRISQLPDEVLVSILSFLTMKEAARTSILARRWHGVWTYIPNLNFDASETLHSLWVGEEGLNLYKERCKYINWVNNVLDAYQGQGWFIDEFQVRFDLDAKYASDIARWFNFSVEKKVKRLVMDFRGVFGSNQKNVCAIPLLSSPVLYTAEFPDCRSLRILHLKYLDISGVVIEHLISTCPYLEQLNIRGSVSLTDLNVVGQSLRLKSLKLKFCSRLKSVYLSAPSLVSFQHYDWKMIEITFANVPNLVEVFFGGGYSLPKLFLLLNYLSQLETLTLSVKPPKEKIGLIEFPVLAHLKNLRLKVGAADIVSLLGFTPLIKAAPSLCRLVLEEWFGKECTAHMEDENLIALNWWFWRPSLTIWLRRMASAGCPQQCLKVVEIVGFVGQTNDLEFASYLLENAPMLEKIILGPPPPKYKSVRCHSSGSGPEYTAILVRSRNGAMLLDSRFSLGDKLVLRF